MPTFCRYLRICITGPGRARVGVSSTHAPRREAAAAALELTWAERRSNYNRGREGRKPEWSLCSCWTDEGDAGRSNRNALDNRPGRHRALKCICQLIWQQNWYDYNEGSDWSMLKKVGRGPVFFEREIIKYSAINLHRVWTKMCSVNMFASYVITFI